MKNTLAHFIKAILASALVIAGTSSSASGALIGEVRQFVEDSPVTLEGKLVTGVFTQDGQQVFYIQEDDRSAGIKVSGYGAAIGITAGDVVDVVAVFKTIINEKTIVASSISFTPDTISARPVVVSNQMVRASFAGTLPEMQGRLIKTSGRVVTVNPYKRTLDIDDSTNVALAGEILPPGMIKPSLRVSFGPGSATLPAVGDYLIVSGCVGAEQEIIGDEFNSVEYNYPIIRATAASTEIKVSVPPNTRNLQISASNVQGRPVLLDFTKAPLSTFDLSAMRPDGKDMIATDTATGTQLPCWWQDRRSASRQLWVKLPSNFSGNLTLKWGGTTVDYQPKDVIQGGIDAQVEGSVPNVRAQMPLVFQGGQSIGGLMLNWNMAPRIHRLPNGNLMLMWFAGPDLIELAGTKSLFYSISTDDGIVWSVPVRHNTPTQTADHRNVVAIFNDGANVRLIYRENPLSSESGPLYIQTSTDNAATWGPSSIIRPASETYVGNNNALVLSNGDWLFSAHNWFSFRQFMFASANKGQSWTLHNVGIISPSIQPNEAAIFEAEPGHVVAYMRTAVNMLRRADSWDYGRTWQGGGLAFFLPTPFVNPMTKPEALKMSSGKVVLANNEWPQKDFYNIGARRNLVLYVSDDLGYTWPRKLLIDDSYRNYGYNIMYPTLIEDSQGNLLVFFVRVEERSGTFFDIQKVVIPASEIASSPTYHAHPTYGDALQADGNGDLQKTAQGVRFTRPGHGLMLNPTHAIDKVFNFPIWTGSKLKIDAYNTAQTTWPIKTLFTGDSGITDVWASVAHRPETVIGKFSVWDNGQWVASNATIPSGEFRLEFKALDFTTYEVYLNGQPVTTLDGSKTVFTAPFETQPENIVWGRTTSLTLSNNPSTNVDMTLVNAYAAQNPLLDGLLTLP